jgi:hypothetical protein
MLKLAIDADPIVRHPDFASPSPPNCPPRSTAATRSVEEEIVAMHEQKAALILPVDVTSAVKL